MKLVFPFIFALILSGCSYSFCEKSYIDCDLAKDRMKPDPTEHSTTPSRSEPAAPDPEPSKECKR